ncbi:hypothetical protein HK100_009822 [Physocladia obscura]|uniref:NmrA-like domain-containing protein n=1 Tax=Physocladia obscura TaxID=109957 RepID=A0AAD5T2Y4_9FUNG|nr:hypothetical protein HK100_009822 [Physocladia obscura]
MPSVKNVVLIGAGGNLGVAVLKEFLASPLLKVTVVSRPESTSVFPNGVRVIKTAYTLESLTAAFANQDAIISLVGTPGFAVQKTIIDAAVAAKVSRFFPSEYGSNTSSAQVIDLVPFLKAKAQTVEYLKSLEAENKISWTALVTGPFFDRGLTTGFLGFKLADKTVRLWDGGDSLFAATTLPSIGKALVSLVSKQEAFEKSRNQYVFISSHVTTQNDILKALKAATASSDGVEWTVSTNVDSQARVAEVKGQIAKGDFSSTVDLLLAATYGKSFKLGTFPEYWNELLELPNVDLDEAVNALL